MSNTQLPAHLLALFAANPELSAVGKDVINEAIAKIRYDGKEWRLLPASGEEIKIKPTWLKDANGQPVGTEPSNQLDVIIVDINPHKSHTVYETAFDIDAEPTAPVWSSHDGTPVPAEHETKKVSDYRHVAALIADNVEGGVYELRISSASITNFDRYNTTIRNYGIPIGAMITRITFDPAFKYPKLSFAPASYLTEAQAKALGEATTHKKGQIQAALGLRQGNPALLAAPAPVAALPAPMVQVHPSGPAPAPARKPRQAKVEGPATAPFDPSALGVGPFVPSAPVAPSPAAAVVTKPQAATTELDTLLNNIMGER